VPYASVLFPVTFHSTSCDFIDLNSIFYYFFLTYNGIVAEGAKLKINLKYYFWTTVVFSTICRETKHFAIANHSGRI
jgi:hypothetical protein